MAGYSRTNTSDIQSGETVKSAPLNAELNAVQTAFAQSGGHKHDGSTEGAYIALMSDADNDTKIQVEESTDEDKIRFDIAGTEQVIIQDGAIVPTTDNDIDLGTSSLEFKDAHFDGTVTTDILAVDETTTLTGAVTLGNILSLPDGSASAPSITNTSDTNQGLFFSGTDTMAFTAGGTAQFTMADGVIAPVTDSDVDLGTSSLYFKDAYIDTVTTTGNIAAGGTITSTGTLQATNNATVGGTLTVTGATTLNSTVAATGKITADAGIDIDNINIDGTTIALSSGALTLDAAGDIVLDAGGGDVTLKDDGTTFATLTNTSGDLIIKSGTTTAVTFSGANASLAGTLTVAGTSTLAATSFGDADITNVGNIALDSITADGSTITITGNTTFADGAYDFDIASHDTSNGLKLGGTLVTATAAELNILDGVTATASELNTLDGVTAVVGELNALDLGSTAVGTAIASKAVVLDSNKDYTGIRNFTITGNLTVGGTQTVVDTVTMNAQNAIVFEGASADDHETTLTITDPTADRTIKLPNQSGTIPVLAADSDTAITSTPAELNILDGVTATTAELNIMDGVTATTAELNIMDGVTATTAELNIMDGVTATATELNLMDGVTSTTAELNIVDGDTSATSTTIVDADRVVLNDNGTMVQAAVSDLRTYLIVDEDNFSSDSATKMPSQQSVKAYITTVMGSVSSAAASATAAAASFDSFDDIYLGSKSSAPSVDNDGDALATGSLYFNSSTNVLNVRTSAGGWTNAGSSVNGTTTRESFIVGTNSTNSAGVSYSGSLTSFPISYDAGFVDVYLNGVRLVNGTDVTVTSGSAVVLASNATAGDTVDIVGFGTFELADHYTKTAADARYAQLSGATFTGNVSAGSNNLTATGTVSLGPTSFNDQNITNVGNIALDSITADGSTITITGNTTFADGSYDFNIASHDGTNGLALGGTVVTASAAELNYVDGVTSAIQTQLDAKAPLASPTFTGDVTLTGASHNVIFDASDNALEFADNAKAIFGTGADMSIYHDSNHSYITNTTGTLKIATENSGVAVTIGHTTSEVTVADNLTVTGDLTVNGATTTVATTNTTVADHLIKLGQGYTGSANDQGFIVTRGDGSSSNTANKGFIWDESADEFATIAGNTEAGTTTGNVTINDYANLHVGALVADDSVSIGGTTITSTAAELNILDGVTSTATELNLLDGSSANSVVNSKAVIYGSSGEVAGTLSTAAQTNITSLGTLTALTVDDITIDGSTISDGGDLTIDVAGDIHLDADGGDIKFFDGGTEFARHYYDSNHYKIYTPTNNGDILFQGTDNSGSITALTLDMSEAGAATFNDAVDAKNFKVNGAQGSDGQVLTSTGSGVGWEAIPASGSRVLIGKTTLSSAGTSLTVTGLTTSYSQYEIFALMKHNGGDNARVAFRFFFGDSSGNLDTNSQYRTVVTPSYTTTSGFLHYLQNQAYAGATTQGDGVDLNGLAGGSELHRKEVAFYGRLFNPASTATASSGSVIGLATGQSYRTDFAHDTHGTAFGSFNFTAIDVDSTGANLAAGSFLGIYGISNT